MVDVFALSVAAIVLGSVAVVALLGIGVYALLDKKKSSKRSKDVAYNTRLDNENVSLSEMHSESLY
jgi:hypothetical protein